MNTVNDINAKNNSSKKSFDFNIAEETGEINVKANEIVLGIDFGTTNSQASFRDLNNREVLVESYEGSGDGKAFPSVVAYQFNDEVLAGKKAYDLSLVKNLTGISVISRIKKLIHYNLDSLKKYYKKNPNSELEKEFGIPTNANGKEVEPIEVASIIFKKIKEEAERQLGDTISYAVVTVPAYYNEVDRLNTKMAAKMAGLTVLRLINEPTAAAIAYGYNESTEKQRILVFDLGGGTFDASLVDINDGIIKVVSSSGVSQAGGTNLTDAIANHIIDYWNFEYDFDIRADKEIIRFITQKIELAKISLSLQFETNILIPDITISGKSYNLTYLLKRDDLPKICSKVLNKIEKKFKELIKEYNLEQESIDVVMVGGPTRAKLIDDFVKKILPNCKINKKVNPMNCVSLGAAIQGSILKGQEKDIVLLDVANISIGVETQGGIFEKIIEKNSTIPCIRSRDNFTNPTDDAVAINIAIYRGERMRCSENEFLGTLELTGLPKLKAHEARIKITLEIDADGVIKVKAEEEKTKVIANTVLKVKGQLTTEEINKIVSDAEKNKEEDENFKKNMTLENDLKFTNYELKKLKEEIEVVEKSGKDVSKINTIVADIQLKIAEGKETVNTHNYEELELILTEIAKLKQKIITLIGEISVPEVEGESEVEEKV